MDIVVDKALLACRETGIECLVAAGGVAANTYLRRRLDEAPVRTVYPSLPLCTDNAAMIAGLGYQLLARGERSGLEVNARARVGEFRARYPERLALAHAPRMQRARESPGPLCNVARTRARSPASNAPTSRHSPGNILLRRIPQTIGGERYVVVAHDDEPIELPFVNAPYEVLVHAIATVRLQFVMQVAGRAAGRDLDDQLGRPFHVVVLVEPRMATRGRIEAQLSVGWAH